MRLRIFTVAIDLIPALVKHVAGRFQSYAGLDRTYFHSVLSRNNFYNVKGLSFFHGVKLTTTTPEGQILANSGLLVAGSIPIPSMSDVELDKVGRSNNKKSTYKIHHVELSDLYGSRAGLPHVYPLLLINNCELNENEEKFGLVPAADKSHMAGKDQLIISTNEASLENYEEGWGVAFTMVLLHNLRGLYWVANSLTASLSPTTARIAEFLTTVFQPVRYEMVQAYCRLVHFLCRENRTAVNNQKQQPLSVMTHGSSWRWNYRMITSRHLAVTWEDTHVAANAA